MSNRDWRVATSEKLQILDTLFRSGSFLITRWIKFQLVTRINRVLLNHSCLVAHIQFVGLGDEIVEMFPVQAPDTRKADNCD